MPKDIFINLPVKDLDRSISFFTKLGFKFNPQFTDERGTCMVINDTGFIMLLERDFFQSFTKRQICESEKSVETIIALSLESKEKVNEMVDAALKAGAKEPDKKQENGWMYQRSFHDPDGHLWEIVWIDMEKIPK